MFKESMKQKLLILLDMGGHRAQASKLTELIKRKADKEKKELEFEYVSLKEDKIKLKTPTKGKVYKMNLARKRFDLKAPLKILRSLIQALSIILRSNPNAIISCGPSAPLFWFWSKIFGAKFIFVESRSRIYKLSLTGKLLYGKTDLYFVQWSELKEKFPKAIYAGMIS